MYLFGLDLKFHKVTSYLSDCQAALSLCHLFCFIFSRSWFISSPLMSGLYTLLFSSILGCHEWAGLPLIWIRLRWLTPPPPQALFFTGGILRMLIFSPLGITEIREASLLTWKCPEVDLYSKLRPVKLSWMALQMSGMPCWNCSTEFSLFIRLDMI